MGWFSPKSAETVVETAAKGIYNGLDKLVHTSEEKTEQQMQENKEYRAWALQVLELTKDASPARREIALGIMGVWRVIAYSVVLLIIMKLGVEDTTKIDSCIKDLITLVQMNFIWIPVSAAVGFYLLAKIKLPGVGK